MQPPDLRQMAQALCHQGVWGLGFRAWEADAAGPAAGSSTDGPRSMPATDDAAGPAAAESSTDAMPATDAAGFL